MSWLRVDDGFAEHPKVAGLSDRAFRLHMASLCYCARNLTDGALTPKAVKVVCAVALATKKHVGELVDAGLWLEESSGHAINDYLDWNPPAEKVKSERAKARARMGKRRSSGERSPEHSAEHKAERSQEVPTHVRGPRPVPSSNENPKAVTSDEGTAQDFNLTDITPTLREIA